MRKNIVAGNWKMNTSLQEGIELAKQVNELVKTGNAGAEVIIAPPFIHLAELNKILTHVKLGAQNCASESGGAFTGEISAGMIASTGATHVIIGHSERRSYYHEDDALLKSKVKLALENGLFPVFCCGEVLSEREAGNHFDVVRSQIGTALFSLTSEELAGIIIAYEPVWAIGTGVNASPEQAQEMHAFIRRLIAEHFGEVMADKMSILYGGSCKPSNAEALFANPDVDGGLIGGASLKAEDFMAIASAF